MKPCKNAKPSMHATAKDWLGERYVLPADAGEKAANYGYFPILVRPEYPLNREELYQKLRITASMRVVTSIR